MDLPKPVPAHHSSMQGLCVNFFKRADMYISCIMHYHLVYFRQLVCVLGGSTKKGSSFIDVCADVPHALGKVAEKEL